jgi:hypothetical protein
MLQRGWLGSRADRWRDMAGQARRQARKPGRHLTSRDLSSRSRGVSVVREGEWLTCSGAERQMRGEGRGAAEVAYSSQNFGTDAHIIAGQQAPPTVQTPRQLLLHRLQPLAADGELTSRSQGLSVSSIRMS